MVLEIKLAFLTKHSVCTFMLLVKILNYTSVKSGLVRYILPVPPVFLFVHMWQLYDCYDFQMKNSLMKDSCIKRQYFWGASTPFLIRPVTCLHYVLRAWDSSPHLPVTPVQLMRPGIGQIHAKHNIYIFRKMWFVVHVWLTKHLPV